MELPKSKSPDALERFKEDRSKVYEANKNKVVEHLQKRGLRKEAIAAMLANIDVETGGSFDFTQKQTVSGRAGDSEIVKGGGVGLFQFDDYKKRFSEFKSIHNKLEEENNTLKEDVNNKENTINSLQEQIGKLKDYEKYAEYKDKFDDLSNQYEKEKDRLTKLYKLYEETESECNRLKVETKGWQKWFDSNREIFDKLFSTSPPIGTQKKKETNTTSSVSDTSKNSTEELKKEEGNEKTKSKDKKRKLRFIK